MDERKKTIAGLEVKKQESRRSITLILEDFGEALFNRIQGREELSGDGEEYLRLRKEIADSESFIKLIEEDTVRLKELEDEIREKEQQNTALCRDLAEICAQLGRQVLHDPEFEVLTAPYKQQIDVLVSKIEELEEKLSDLEEKARTNVFAWMGRNAKGMVYRTLFSKKQESLEKLYKAMGEKLTQEDSESLVAGHEIADAVREAAALKEKAAGAGEELARLTGERRRIGDTFGAEGGPVKRIQGLEKHIAHIRGELKLVYCRFGEAAANQALVLAEEQASGQEVSETEAGTRLASILTPDDKPVLDKLALLRSTVEDYAIQIEKLKTAIAIDDEKATIDKLKKGIEDYRRRIKSAESAITELEGRIAESENHIKELESRL
jgi:chromosome segregation ATPase